MNEMEHEIRERRSIADSASCRVDGKKRRRCRLPSDYLSEEQLRSLSGPVRSWNLRRPMAWKDFQTMPNDLQQRYLRELQERVFGKDHVK